jgi:autoinducer 2-degrading protein
MFVVVVSLQVKPDRVQDFTNAIFDNARNTRLEPGNVRFDVLQDTTDPTRFVLYEAYTSTDGHKSHQQTAHYLKWRDKVTDWMAQPRTSTKNNALFFGEGVL